MSDHTFAFLLPIPNDEHWEDSALAALVGQITPLYIGDQRVGTGKITAATRRHDPMLGAGIWIETDVVDEAAS